VPEDHRLAQPHRAKAAVVVVVQIGAADPAALDAQPDLASRHLAIRQFVNAKVLCGMNNNSFHQLSLVSVAAEPAVSAVSNNSGLYRHVQPLADQYSFMSPV